MITHDPEDLRAFAQTLVTYEDGRVCEIQGSLRSEGQERKGIIPDDPYACPVR
jgi:ABC-type thiamine transport system ATPase subunit